MGSVKPIELATKGYNLLIRFGNLILQPVVLLLLRLHWGWAYYETGKGKLLNHGDVTEFFTSLGIPMPSLNAWFVGGVECVGGMLLLVGFLSRPVAAVLTVNMLVAYISVTSDRAKLFGIFSDPDAFVGADPFFYLMLAVVILAFGAGSISVDALLSKTILKKLVK